MNKLMIAVPILDYVHRRFAESLANLTKHLGEKGIQFDVVFEGCTLVYISRDNLVKKAMDGKYDWVLWLDADMVFEPDIFEKLLNTGKDFVSGIYRGRHGTHRPCIFDEISPPRRWDSFDRDEPLYQIEGCGFGGVLIKKDILESVMLQNGTCFRPTALMGEDIAFCKRAMEQGYEIWADLDVKLGHIASYVIEPFCDEESMTDGKILKLA